MKMKIIIDNLEFGFDEGVRLAKMKYRTCPEHFADKIGDIWDDIQPLKFSDIAKWDNLEKRRIGMLYLGIERMIQEVQPELVSKKVLDKNTTWINSKGEIESIKFKDTYELYKVDGKKLNENVNRFREPDDVYFVKCYCTSTQREYLIWVNWREVYRTKYVSDGEWFDIREAQPQKLDAIDAIAWTITTDVPKNCIEKIIRQGDCILIKPKPSDLDWKLRLTTPRHLTAKEYKELLVAES